MNSLIYPSYWICVRCGQPALHGNAEVDVDDFGCYFLCMACGRRNQLECVSSSQDETSAFVQVDDARR